MNKNIRCIQSGILSGGKWDKLHDESRRYYSPTGISPTLHTFGGKNTEVKIIFVLQEDETPKIHPTEQQVRTLNSELR